jgi:hypothetical protein
MSQAKLIKTDIKEHFEISLHGDKYYATHESNTSGHDKWYVFGDDGLHEDDAVYNSVTELCYKIKK